MYGPRTQAYGETNYLKEKLQVLDRTKVLYGPRTQAYEETKYSKNYKFWTEPRPCMVLGLKPMGKPSTQKNTSFGQNQGLIWSSDSSLWGNQVQKRNLISFGQNQGLAWSSDSSLWGNQVQKKNLTSFGQNQGLAWSSDSSLWGNQLLVRKNYITWTLGFIRGKLSTNNWVSS